MRPISFWIGFGLVAAAGVFWALDPGSALRLGVLAGAAVAVVNLAMLLSRRDRVSNMGARGAVAWVRVSFIARAAVIVLVLLLLRKSLGTAGTLAFLGGFFVVEAAMLVPVLRGKG